MKTTPYLNEGMGMYAGGLRVGLAIVAYRLHSLNDFISLTRDESGVDQEVFNQPFAGKLVEEITIV